MCIEVEFKVLKSNLRGASPGAEGKSFYLLIVQII